MQYWTPKSDSLRAGEWLMLDDREKIVVIRELNIGPRAETMFRAVSWAECSRDRVLIGYFPHLAMAVEISWREYRRAIEQRGHAGR